MILFTSYIGMLIANVGIVFLIHTRISAEGAPASEWWTMSTCNHDYIVKNYHKYCSSAYGRRSGIYYPAPVLKSDYHFYHAYSNYEEIDYEDEAEKLIGLSTPYNRLGPYSPQPQQAYAQKTNYPNYKTYNTRTKRLQYYGYKGIIEGYNGESVFSINQNRKVRDSVQTLIDSCCNGGCEATDFKALCP